MDSGLVDSDTGTASKRGLMEQSTKESGGTTKRTGEGSSITWTETSLMESGRTIKLMASALTTMSMGPNTRASGWMTSKRATAKRPGKMAQCMKANTARARSTDMAATSGVTDQPM